jgi:hypothetical protein
MFSGYTGRKESRRKSRNSKGKTTPPQCLSDRPLKKLLTSLNKLGRGDQGDLIKFVLESKDQRLIKKIAVAAQKKPLTDWLTIPKYSLASSMQIFFSVYFPENKALDHYKEIQGLLSVLEELTDPQKEQLRTSLASFATELSKISVTMKNRIGALGVSQILLMTYLDPGTYDTLQNTAPILQEIAASYKNIAVGLLNKAEGINPTEVRAISNQLIDLNELSLAKEIMPASRARRRSSESKHEGRLPTGSPSSTSSPIPISKSSSPQKTNTLPKLLPQPNFYSALAANRKTLENSREPDKSENLSQSPEAKLPDPLPSAKNNLPPSESPGKSKNNSEKSTDTPVKDSDEVETFPKLTSEDTPVIEKEKKASERKKDSYVTSTASASSFLFQNDAALQTRIKKLFAASDGSQLDKSKEILSSLTAFENALNQIKYPNASTEKITHHFRELYLAFKNTSPPETKGQDEDVLTLHPVVAPEETTLTNAAYWETINTHLTAIKHTLRDPRLKGSEFNGLRTAFYMLIGALAGGLIAAGLGAVASTIGGVAAAGGVSALIIYSLFSCTRGLGKQIREKGQDFVEVVDKAMKATAPKNNS